MSMPGRNRWESETVNGHWSVGDELIAGAVAMGTARTCCSVPAVASFVCAAPGIDTHALIDYHETSIISGGCKE
jgi:hypothetical protein